jgi:hypothetical protein
MMVHAELHAHSRFSFSDGAGGPEELVAEDVRIPTTVATVTVRSLDARDARSCVGWQRDCATTTFATFNANSHEATLVDFTPARVRARRDPDGFGVDSGTVDWRLTGKDKIYGSTSDNGISVTIFPPSSYYRIYGPTSDDVVFIFVTFSRVFALNTAGTNSNIGWRRSATTTTLVRTISANFDEATPLSLTPRGWTSSLTVTVLTVTPDSIDCDGVRACQWRTAGICDR